MAKKTKKSLEVEHHEAPIQTIYSNAFGLGFSDTEVVINFGLSAPSYFEPHDDEDMPVARVLLSWEVAEGLLEVLKRACEEHKNPQKPERKAKRKGKGGSDG